jgi:hypothetical protein
MAISIACGIGRIAPKLLALFLPHRFVLCHRLQMRLTNQIPNRAISTTRHHQDQHRSGGQFAGPAMPEQHGEPIANPFAQQRHRRDDRPSPGQHRDRDPARDKNAPLNCELQRVDPRRNIVKKIIDQFRYALAYIAQRIVMRRLPPGPPRRFIRRPIGSLILRPLRISRLAHKAFLPLSGSNG